jgi:hypothetical protein
MAGKIKKGDTVTVVGVYSRGDRGRRTEPHAGMIYTRPCVVESWGKVQATLRDAASGEMVRYHVCTERAGLSVATTAEEVAALVEKRQAEIDAGRARSIALHPSFAELAQFTGKPARVDSYAALTAETVARLRAAG